MSRDDAICFDLSEWSQITITGDERREFLHNFCTNDIKRLQPGQGCEAFVPDIRGRILGHVLVFATDSSLRLVAVPGSADAIAPHLRKYLLGNDAEVQVESPNMG
ncbi:MAG: hypothetical protein KDA80_23600, partial [Planctomycetaceae bacterium]|nr:hypothetical protein [Planctomycetaceae bacterium]